MSHELICTWLGLPAGEWPPNHYRLLGLEPGETDIHLIEQRVHQRLDAVRRYQMMHPEPATEAMNRLAQAFVCLTEPTLKRQYDTTVLGLVPPPAATQPPPLPASFKPTTSPPTWGGPGPARSMETMLMRAVTPPDVAPPLTGRETQVIDLSQNDTVVPPVRIPTTTPDTSVETGTDVAVAEPPVRRQDAPLTRRLDPAVELAQSPLARRSLGTKRAFTQRIGKTRRLLQLWQQLGPFLSNPRKRLPAPREAGPFIELMENLDLELADFPPVMGEAGQPGYLLVYLAGQARQRPNFHTFDLDQRRSLSRDWHSGRRLLLAHRDFLFRELRRLRRQGFGRWVVRAVRSFVNERPGMIFLGIAALAVGALVIRTWVASR